MTNVAAVAGEHRNDPVWLVLAGDDGLSYAYTVVPTEGDRLDE